MLIISQLAFLVSQSQLRIFNNCIGIFCPSNVKGFSGTAQDNRKIFEGRINGIEGMMLVTKEGQILVNLIRNQENTVFLAELTNNQHEISGLGYLATEAAYRYGKDWLEELKQVFEDHIHYVVDLFGKETNIKVMKPQGTYLIWLDFSAYDLTDEKLQELLRNEAKVILNRGLDFGEEGSLHARLNVAMPKSLLQEVCQRIVATFAKL